MFFHICIYVYDLIAVDVSNLKGFHLIVPIPQFIMSELTRHVRVNSLHVPHLHLDVIAISWSRYCSNSLCFSFLLTRTVGCSRDTGTPWWSDGFSCGVSGCSVEDSSSHRCRSCGFSHPWGGNC